MNIDDGDKGLSFKAYPHNKAARPQLWEGSQQIFRGLQQLK